MSVHIFSSIRISISNIGIFVDIAAFYYQIVLCFLFPFIICNKIHYLPRVQFIESPVTLFRVVSTVLLLLVHRGIFVTAANRDLYGNQRYLVGRNIVDGAGCWSVVFVVHDLLM
jgi:hypothetical protein